MKRDDFDKAALLRKQGLSYKSINEKLGVPKSTLSNWFSDEDWSNKIKNKLTDKRRITSSLQAKKMAEQNKINFAEKVRHFRERARQEYALHKDSNLFQAGLMIYLGEGDNKFDHSLVRLSNINPKIILIFMQFLSQVCNVEIIKIKATMILYKDLNENICKTYWNQFLNLSPENFYKTQYIIGRHKKRRISYGICNISVSDRELKEKIYVWTELLSEQLTGRRV
ncbi:MAG: hypothetical protein ABH810_02320 [bacterium]